jgi:hypothetical protein
VEKPAISDFASGIEKVNLLPFPISLWISILPFSKSRIALFIDNPNPWPRLIELIPESRRLKRSKIFF